MNKQFSQTQIYEITELANQYSDLEFISNDDILETDNDGSYEAGFSEGQNLILQKLKDILENHKGI
jgi:hypothetical protein